MTDTQYNTPLFGISINPTVKNVQHAFKLAQVADSTGLDFITIQDHPYNPTFLDTWTLFVALATATQQIRVLPNVLNLPLRPPVMLAKEAATLDILTNGRVEMALGAGGFWEAIVSASYVPPENIPELQAVIDDAAQAAGRDTTAIRRAYNVAGTIVRPGAPALSARRRGIIAGPVNQWADELMRYYSDLRMDTFILWPIGDEETQIRTFAEEVVPALKERINLR